MTIVCEILILILWGTSVLLLYRILKRMPVWLSKVQQDNPENPQVTVNLYIRYASSAPIVQLCLSLLSAGLACGAWLHTFSISRYFVIGAPIFGLVVGLLFGSLFNINGKKYGAIQPEEKFFNKISINGVLYGFFYCLELASFLLMIFAFSL